MFRSPSAGSIPHSSATQTKFIQERILAVEKHFGNICSALANYTKKIAGQRDEGDVLAQTLQDYAAVENVNRHCSQGIREFADSLAFISDYRDVCVHRIEENVIHDISSYGAVCKSAMEDVRSCSLAYEKEVAHHKHVHKLRQQNPLGRMQISKAESDLQQAATQSVRLAKSLEERVDKLEKKKLQDLMGWLKRLALIEMSFHSSALAILGRAYRQLGAVDLDLDLEEFRNTLRLHLPPPMAEAMSPIRTQSAPSIALPKTPTFSSERDSSSTAKIKRSKSFSDYRQRAESLDSLKVEEYEELNHDSEDDDETEESEEDEAPSRPRSQGRRK